VLYINIAQSWLFSSKYVQGFWSHWGWNFGHVITLAIAFYNSLYYVLRISREYAINTVYFITLFHRI